MNILKKIDVVMSKLPLFNVFSTKKVLKNKWINKMGIQPYRVKLAERKYNNRPKYITSDIIPIIESLEKDGVALIKNFLPQSKFLEVEKECIKAIKEIEFSVTKKHGPTTYENISSERLRTYSALTELFNNGLVEKIFKAAERRNLSLNEMKRLLECVTQGKDKSIIDPETVLHEDTYFNTFKAWLYITDVQLENAPFVYVKGSHKNQSIGRYEKAYNHSLQKDNIKSRRITKNELETLNMEETHFIVPKNTFVIANTLGFHRRLRGEAGEKRISVAFSARFNPFL